MDATDRVAAEFDRLVAMGRAGVALRPITERYLYYIVATRCDIDIAGEFRRGYDLLRADSFYQHYDLKRISQTTHEEINAIGHFVADQLWDLDGKLANLLDAVARPDTP